MTKRRLSDPDVLLSILDNLPTSIFVKDENLKFVFSNKLHCQIIGKEEADLLGKCDFDFYPVEDANVYAEHDSSVIDFGEESHAEETARNQNGMKMPVLTRKARLDGPDGKVYLLGTNSDLTDIRRRENQYRALSETVPVGVAQVDESCEVIFANPLFNAYCGGDCSETDQARMIRKLRAQHAVFPGQACKFEAVVQGLGNQPRNVIVISSGWLDLGDSTRSATISLIDISQMTELQRINDEVVRLNQQLAANVAKLAEAQDELVKKGRMEQLGQLTATVAHELRNPLGAVRTSAFLLERKLRDKNMGVESQLDRINKGILRCDNIITQLLDFSRSKQLQCQAGDLDAWLTTLIEEEARKLPANVQVELVLGLDQRQIPFDGGRLQRAVINMISNAVEAMLGNGDQLQVSGDAPPSLLISTHREEDHVSLRVSDNGPGIAPEVLACIREPLFTTKSFGTGLGIPAIEQIAIQHGGRLDIASEVGRGTKFTVWLPMKPKAETEKAA